jgi:hypothetical protein
MKKLGWCFCCFLQMGFAFAQKNRILGTVLDAKAASLCSCFYSKHECHAADRHRWKIQF